MFQFLRAHNCVDDEWLLGARFRCSVNCSTTVSQFAARAAACNCVRFGDNRECHLLRAVASQIKSDRAVPLLDESHLGEFRFFEQPLGPALWPQNTDIVQLMAGQFL